MNHTSMLLRILVISIVFLSARPISSEAQTWEWVSSMGKGNPLTSNTGFTSIANYQDESLLMIGGSFDTTAFSGCAAMENIPYMVRLDQDGNCQTVIEIPHLGHDVQFDSDGRCLVVGAHGTEGFISKYDINDQLQWTKNISGVSSDSRLSVAIDHTDEVIMAGHIGSTGAMNGCVPEGDPAINRVFLVKYDAQGDCVWMRQSSADIRINDIATDAAGNMFLVGRLKGQLNLDGHELTSSGVVDVFVAKFDQQGTCLWARTGGGSAASINYSKDEGYAISVTDDEHVLITGSFTDTATFGPVQLQGRVGNNIFVVKYDTDGDVVWAKGFGDQFDNEGYAMALTAYGNVVIGGRFVNHIWFDHIRLEGTGHYDMFILEMDGSGNVVWAQSGGGSEWNDNVTSLAMSGNELLLSGIFHGNAEFGPFQLTNEIGPREFLAKISGVTDIGHTETQDYQLTIHPNPTASTTTLTWQGQAQTDYRLQLFDALGRQVAPPIRSTGSGQVLPKGKGKWEIDMSALAKGIYFGRLLVGEEMRSFKVVRE